jgi:glycosyltransferase involved in cell wall biosynthesis
MLRILFATDNLNIGGTELNAFRTAARLHRRHAEVSVLAMRPEGPLAAAYEAEGITVTPCRIRHLAGVRTVRRQAELFSFLRKTRPDVFHSHDKYSNIFGTPVARAAGIPAVVASRRWNHSDDGTALAVANRTSYAFAHAVLFNSSLLEKLVGDRERIPPRKRKVIPNFIEQAAFSPPSSSLLSDWRRELDLHRAIPIIGIVANLRPVKDHATLLEAARILLNDGVDYYLVIAGAGDQVELTARARELGLAENVRFAGPRPSRPSFHYLFDISVLTSISEGFSNSILEAMAASKPVVATHVGGIPDAVKDGESGILFPPRDSHACAAALRRLIKDPGLMRRMGQRGQELAAAQFSDTEVIPRLVDLYAALLTKKVKGKRM